MKKFQYLSLPVWQSGLIIIFTLLLAFPLNSFAKEKGNGNTHHTILQKTTAGGPAQSIIDVGNITSWVRDDGTHYWNVASSWNGAYPNGTSAGAIYSEGILWAGLVNDGQTPTLRVNGNTYQNGTLTLLTQTYRVRSDYLTADLSQDAADFYMENVTDVTPDQLSTIKAQYLNDWLNWPVNEGAPYANRDGVPGYQPDPQGRTDDPADTSKHFDVPGIPGATQTLFIKYNDSNSESNYGMIPIGLNISETYWAYSAGTLANIIFKKVDIIYTGTANSSSNASIDSLYLIQWADPDVGNSTDDFAGCDTALNMSYCYSSGYTDAVYQGLGLAPPAVGYDFLQGASHFTGNPNDSAIFNLKWRKGYKYINPKPMSTSIYFAAGGTWTDPEFNQDGAGGWFNMCRGDLPVPPYPAGTPFPAAAADVTPYGTYLLDGDPVFGSGKIDGAVDGPGDRRLSAINGPITLNLHDTAEVVLALVGGLGTSNISSISVMKFNDASAQYAYDQLFNIPLMPQPIVQSFGLDDKVVLNWGQPASLDDQIENGDHGVYKFQGYSVYQLPPGGTNIAQGVRIATFDLIDLTTVLYDKFLDPGTGLIITKPAVVLKNEGLQRYLTITQDQIFNKPLANGLNYTFAVTAMAYNSDPNLPANILESSPYIVNVTPQKPAPGFSYEQEGAVSSSEVTHVGTADATADVNLIDPSKLTGDQYQVTFHNEMYSLGSNGIWTDITPPKKLGKVTDLTGSSISSAASYSETQGDMDVHYTVNIVSADFDFCDGVEIFFPSNVTIDTTYEPASSWNGGTIPFTINRTTNSIFYGDSSRSTGGAFGGGEDILVVVHPASVPMIVNYNMYDDGYGGNIVDVSGIDTLKSVSNKIVIQNQWNVTDLTMNNVVLKNQTVYNGQDIYAPDYYFQHNSIYGPGGSSGSMTANVSATANVIFDNSIQVAVNGNFTSPINYYSIKLSPANSPTRLTHSSSTTTLDIQNYTIFGGVVTSTAIDNFGVGVSDDNITELQKDYELRFTGKWATKTVNGQTVKYVASGGQMATVFRMVNAASLATNPLNPNYGTAEPFLIRIPFEVWSIDDNRQVNLTFRDRERDGTEDPFYAWSLDTRMYAIIVNSAYDSTQVIQVDNGPDQYNDPATWVLVFYGTNYNMDYTDNNYDDVTVIYANPLQVGVDKFTFDTKAMKYNSTQAKGDISKVNVFPNPYYGYQYRETSRNSHYVTFSHLPFNATIRIFDLSGVLVRTIHHIGPTGQNFDQFEQWDLQNDSGYPVASGIYIAYIDMGNLGTKILKLAIVQEKQILPVY